MAGVLSIVLDSPPVTPGGQFTVTVTDSIPVTQDTDILVTVKSGPGGLGGTVAGTISALSSSVQIGNMYIATAGAYVLTATATSGDAPTAGDTSPFTVTANAPSRCYNTPSPSTVYVNGGFSVALLSTDSFDNPSPVTQDTAIALSVFTGTGNLTGTTTGVILAGQSTAMITPCEYDKAEVSVVLSAASTSGDTLGAYNNGSSIDVIALPPPVVGENDQTISPSQLGSGAYRPIGGD